MTQPDNDTPTWEIFTRASEPNPPGALRIKDLPAPPAWRTFGKAGKPEAPDAYALSATADELERGADFVCSPELAEAVNAALYLRRPLLLTGKPGIGKSTLIYAVARELRLGPVLRWSITSRSTLRDGLYQYDALGRLNERQRPGNDANDASGAVSAANARAATRPPDHKAEKSDDADNIGKYIELGPLGTALLPSKWPRALLIDEIDKSDLDLPNDLLNVFEEGEVHIPELARANTKSISVRKWRSTDTTEVELGKFTCDQFPFVVLTSNGERTFPAPFLRRCIQFNIPDPELDDLEKIVANRLKVPVGGATGMVTDFLAQREKGDIATDQLLNAIFLTLDGARTFPDGTVERLRKILLKELAQIDQK